MPTDYHSASILELADVTFLRDVVTGLARKQRTISPRWFYDTTGSELFEKITELPGYYLTRIEQTILTRALDEIATLVGSGRAVVELGSGSSTKTRALLAGIDPSAYVPIDISGEFLRASVRALRSEFPDLPIHEVEADFTDVFTLPEDVTADPKLGFFPGSTIGNFGVREAVDLLRTTAATLGEKSMLLIGIDRVKNRQVLIDAYDDAQGVTAQFNLNLLRRINRELHGAIPVDAFCHAIRWNEEESRIEMHLEATRDIRFTIGGEHFEMSRHETIHTESCFKYGLREAKLLLRAGGWTPIADWSDSLGQFSLLLARVDDHAPA